MRGVAGHAVLLLVALGLAWTTWSRDEDGDGEEAGVRVWDAAAAEVDSLVYATEEARLVIARRSEGGESWLWGREIPRPPEPTDPDTAGAATGPTVPDTAAFPVGERGEDLLRRLAPLRAVRDLGAVDDDRLAEYGLAEPSDTLVLALSGGEAERLLLGGPVFGGDHRYALEPRSGRVYAIPGGLVVTLRTGRARLREERLHAFEMSRVDRVVLTTSGSERVRVRTPGAPGAPPSWAPPDEPDRPDATFGNFMTRVSSLRPLDYVPTLAVDSLELLARLEYLDDDGEELGALELYRGPAAGGEEVDHYLRTELTRVPARASPAVAERVAEDLEQLFGGGGGAGGPPPEGGSAAAEPAAVAPAPVG